MPRSHLTKLIRELKMRIRNMDCLTDVSTKQHHTNAKNAAAQ